MSDPFIGNPDLVACAGIVERGDPQRFAATMAAPVAARAVLFPIYAFNVEVARAPWVTQEPMIAQMRLQWWADALDEIRAGGMVRRHEVVTPLALAVGVEGAGHLSDVVEARRLDIEKSPFDDEAALLAYLRRTAGGLSLAAVRALGLEEGAQKEAITNWAEAAGLVRYFQAVPELVARGRLPLPDGRPETLSRLATDQLATLRMHGSLRRVQSRLGKGPAAALIEFWQVPGLLKQVARDPSVVAEGRMGQSEFSNRWGLLRAAR